MDRREALIEMARRTASRDFLAFMRWTWTGGGKFMVGRHTEAICDRLTRAVDDYLDGKSTFLVVNVPFRHGKSELVSCALPAYFLGRCAERQPSVIMSGYGATLVQTFSKRCKALMRTPEYHSLFPDIEIDRGRDSVDSWGVTGSVGFVTVAGLGGGITGKGGNLIICDDYCKNYEEAYSQVQRESAWQSFCSDLMSRRNAPASIVVVCATPWHLDDICGRIDEEMKHDPNYPRFEKLVFPARKPGPDGWDHLFPELYTDTSWYDQQRASLGPTMASALLDCNPVGDGNRMFRPEWFQTYTTTPNADEMNRYIIVDSANSKRKESDFTSMQVWGLGRDRNYYLLDAIRDRLDLAGRTDALFGLVERWQPQNVFWEQVGAMSDVAHVKLEMERRQYRFPIAEIRQTVPKIDRIGWLVPVFEAGRIWFPGKLLRLADDGTPYDFTGVFRDDEYLTCPACRHDDMIDCTANLMHPAVLGMTNFPAVRGYDAHAVRPRTRAGEWRPSWR